jgi:hypothetical protein
MSRSFRALARRPATLGVAALFGLLLSSALSSAVWAQSLPVVLQVEEDWELVVDEADANNIAPQVTCTISPNNHLNGLHSNIELNHKTVSSFAGGGVHLQSWYGDYNLSRKSTENTNLLSTPGETITWTMRMKLEDYALSFSVRNGNSSTWGAFGGGTSLHSWYGTSLVNLNGYTPELSVANSGVGFASNRVRSLKLLRVRYTLQDGTVVTDDQVRVVHQLE